MLGFIDYLQRRRCKKKGVRLSSTRHFDSNSHLRLECYSRLGNVEVDQSQSTTQVLEIGAYSYVRSGSRLLSIAEIGRYCSIGRNVTLGLNPRNHPLNWVSTSTQFSRDYNRKVSPLRIGHDVWIGDNAVIMADINIGHGAVIGCNAIVTKDVEPYQIVAGNPARPIRLRFDEQTIAKLLAGQWWLYTRKELDTIDFENVDEFFRKASSLLEKADYGFVELKGSRVV